MAGIYAGIIIKGGPGSSTNKTGGVANAEVHSTEFKLSMDMVAGVITDPEKKEGGWA